MSSSSAFRRIIQEEKEDPSLTGMNLGFQLLTERVIAERTTTSSCTNTQLPVPLISDIVGCDIRIDDIQLAKQKMINSKFDLKKDVNNSQKLPITGAVTPLLHFCKRGNLLIVKLLFLIGADCTQLCKNGYYFPMLAAAERGHLDICKWLFKYGGDAKYQINKENSAGDTPLRYPYIAWRCGDDKEGKTCRWLLQNGGGQHLSSQAVRRFIEITGEEDINSTLLVLWMRENVQLHGTFILLLCGAATMNATLLSSEISNGSTRKSIRQRQRKGGRKRKIHRERSLQILDGHPGIMEVIGDYVGLIRGKEIRMLQEFNELVIEYNTTDEN